MKLKHILLVAIFLLSFTNLYAAQTQCQKQNWSDPTTIEDVKLDGGSCSSKYSVKDMINNGWRVIDIKVESSNNGLNYTYTFSDKQLEQSKYINLNDNIIDMKFDTKFTKLYDVNSNSAKINIPNLKIGQSGIVEHSYPNGNTIIVANGYVIDSNNSYSIIKLEKFDDLKQNAIPSTNKTVQNGDTFILNYLYQSSLLITPNSQSFTIVRDRFKKFNFLHSDIFATYLKLDKEPLPSKNTFIKFAKTQNLGTIFFVVDKKVYMIDAKTFKTLYSYDILYQTNDSQLPFYTRVSEIEKAFWDIDFNKYINFFKDLIGANAQTEEEFLTSGSGDSTDNTQRAKNLSYDAYYKNILGLTNDR